MIGSSFLFSIVAQCDLQKGPPTGQCDLHRIKALTSRATAVFALKFFL